MCHQIRASGVNFGEKLEKFLEKELQYLLGKVVGDPLNPTFRTTGLMGARPTTVTSRVGAYDDIIVSQKVVLHEESRGDVTLCVSCHDVTDIQSTVTSSQRLNKVRLMC